MARLPEPGSDNGTWGEVLNDFLSQSLNPTGTIKDNTVSGSTIAANSITSAHLTGGAVTSNIILDGAVSEAKLDSATRTKLNNSVAAGVASVNTRTGAVTLAKADVGLNNVDNTADSNKPVSTAQQAALDTKAPLNSPTFTGTVTVPTPSNLTDATTKDYVDSHIITPPVNSVAGKTGTVTLTKGDVGLSNVDNTTDLNKPVSTFQQSALDAKAPINSPTFTGTVTVPTPTNLTDATTKGYVDSHIITPPVTSVAGKTGTVTLTSGDVGLSNVDNTSDLNKPISTATQTALSAKADASALGTKILLIANAAALPAGTPAGVIVVVKS